MKKEERKQRLSIALLFTAIVIAIFIAVLLLVAIGLFVLVQLEVLTNRDSGTVSPTELIFIFMASSIALGALLTLFLSRFPMQPINGLINIMTRLASGDFKVRIALRKPWNKHPAIVELADSFNKMAQELEQTEMLRGDFINNFSHEFKTPSSPLRALPSCSSGGI